MQFRDYLSEAENPKSFDCISCQGKNHKCLLYEKMVEVEQPDFQGRGRKKWALQKPEDVEDYLSECIAQVPDSLEIEHLLVFAGTDVCPIPIINPLSVELARMNSFFQAGGFPYPGGYLDQLEIFVQAASIIAAEESELMRRRRKKDAR